MTKTTVIACAVLLILVALGLVFFGAKGSNGAQAPILDPECEAGYTLVGEGCIPNDEACELQGDQYYYDAIANECRTQ